MLTNYKVDGDSRPSNVGPPFTGHFQVSVDTPRGHQPFQPAPKSTATHGKPFADTERALTAAAPSKADLNLEIRRNIYDHNRKEIKASDKQANGDGINGSSENGQKSIEDLVKEPIKKISCYSCGVDCTRVHFHNGKASSPAPGTGASKERHDLCPNCLLEAKFPNSSNAADFVKVENPSYSAIPDRDAPWSDKELMLLLESLEKKDDDWNEVATYVGSRTREECLAKFLQLEIEDRYLDAEPAITSSMGILGGTGGRIPFTQADNPVMSVVGFLAGLVDPGVAAAAAGKTIEELKRGLQEQIEHSPEGEKETDVQEKGKENAADADSMQIDLHHTTTTTTTTTSTLSAMATLPLAVTAARASALASHEEREMTRLVSTAVNATLQKLELKLKQFNEMETLLQAERRELERGRQQLFLDRLSFKKRVREVQERLRTAAATGGEQGVRLAQDAMSGGQTLMFAGAAHHPEGAGNVVPLSAEGPIKSYDI